MNTCVSMSVDCAWAYMSMHTGRCMSMGKLVMWAILLICLYIY